MRLKIFDVSHGFCAYLIADNGNVILFDCGHNQETGFRPSDYLPRNGCRGIEYLIVHNYDQDHISDLANLRKVLPIQILYRNNSVSPQTLKKTKENIGPITDAMDSMIEMAEEYSGTPLACPDLSGIELNIFYNSFPDFTDMNNLSVVAFVHYDGVGIVFPGDLEKTGWEILLQDHNFCENLKKVNIFVASHHGRESGYCRDVFDYCSPDIVITSDKEIIHKTQKNNYKEHAYGVPWNGGAERRYVLTTRSDGMITINKNIGSGYNISI